MAARMFAAVVISSFELEMGIFEIQGKNKIRRVDYVRKVNVLGRDAFHHGRISYELMDELCKALADFARIMKGYGVTDCRVRASNSINGAANSSVVLEQIRVRTGFEVKVLSNSEQRFLTYKAIAMLDEDFTKNIQEGTAILDVGFASMQISLFDKGLLISTENLPLGVYRICDTLKNVRPTVDRTRELILEMVESELSNYKKIYLRNMDIKHLIGTGEVIRYLFRYEDGGKPLSSVTKEKFTEVYEKVSGMREEDIEDAYGVSSEFAKLMLPGAVIFQKFLEMSGAEQVWIPGTRLFDGIAADFAEENKLLKFKHNFENDIISTSRNMAKRYRCKSAHSEAVESFALQIFDTMKRYHGLGKRERLLLQIAAILHSCGKFINIRQANECAYNIIMSTEIIGVTPQERELIANIVRYNINDFDYDMVQDKTITAAKLTAILRLANSMDRGHKQKLAGCRMAMKDDRLVITTAYQGDITAEATSFGQKAEFFREIFGITPQLKQKKII